MVPPFFPSPLFGWCFSTVLLVLLGMAAVHDLRTRIVPKWLGFTILGVGVLATLARGALLGAAGLPTWFLGPGGPWVGLADGFLFALSGVLVGFFVTFALWILGICGGGDVKLTTAAGAWLGPAKVLLVLAGAVVVVVLILLVRLTPQLLQGKLPSGRPRKSRLVTFSLPLALATLAILLAALYNDSQIAEIARAQEGGHPISPLP